MQENFQLQNQKRNLPRDVFLHLLAMVTLYWSAISFVTLLYQFINYFFPLPGYYGDTSFDKFSIASLIIVFPVFLAASWFLNNIYKKESAVRESKVRKWLIYLTLFVATLVMMGDLVTAVLFLLNGDFTVRFVLKVLSILLVAGAIFAYYLDDVRKESPTKLAKPFAVVSAVLVLAAIVGAFFIIGSPTTARELNADNRRVSDLQNIQSEIVNYWQAKDMLPSQLSDLNNSISGFTVPMDPETNQSYQYTVTDAAHLAFQMCATFDLASQNTSMAPTPATMPNTPGSISDTWTHPSGYYCFSRTIDKQLYPPLNSK